MKVLVLPRDENPYQGSLYGAMEERDVEVRYLDGPTSSQTGNLLALPFLLMWHRACGVRLLHVHWVHPFLVSWARGPRARGVVQHGFELIIAFADALGYRIVWTAHNLLPHEPVFRDDAAARRVLIARSDAVIAHSRHTACELEGWGASRVIVVPQGVDGPVVAARPVRCEARRDLGIDPERPVVVFFGNVLAYKGVDLLLDAAAALPSNVELDVLVVGRCRDRGLRADLAARAILAGERVQTHFAFVSELELARYLAAADLAVFPFRAVTNSSSVATALGAGVPVIVPLLPELDDLPDDATVRYQPGSEGLIEALGAASRLDPQARAGLRIGAERYAEEHTWAAAAAATRSLYAEILDPSTAAKPNARCSAGESATSPVLR